MTEITSTKARQIWKNGKIPVVYKPPGKEPLLVRVPFAADNRGWLLGDGRIIHWQPQFKAWELPRSRFDDILRRCILRYGELFAIQGYRPLETCAPACWNALGFDCECSCLGANHGSGRELSHTVSETFAFEWGERRLACRHIVASPEEQVA